MRTITKLIPIEKLKKLYENKKSKNDLDIFAVSLVRFNGFYINHHMLKKFGDGKKYTFTSEKRGLYSHRCVEDGYYYHEDWFCDDKIEKIGKDMSRIIDNIFELEEKNGQMFRK